MRMFAGISVSLIVRRSVQFDAIAATSRDGSWCSFHFLAIVAPRSAYRLDELT